jgi:hypothetical protein
MTIFLCLIALLEWVWILGCGIRSGRMGVLSPLGLFASGTLVFYIVSPLYWQFREWTYPYPSYVDGLPLLLTCVILFGLPFLLIHGTACARSALTIPLGAIAVTRSWAVVFASVAAVGVAWNGYLITQGHQGVMVREETTILGSSELASLFSNLVYVSPVAYFLLMVQSDSSMRRMGALLWCIDGIVTVLGFNRTFILLFIVQSMIQARLLGWRVNRKYVVALLALGLCVVGILGRSKNVSIEVVLEHKATYMTPALMAEVFTRTIDDVIAGKTEKSGSANSGIDGLVDDVANRLYDARSASAVMAAVPDQIPYRYGSTFGHILYAFIPRAIWEDKPSLREIHLVTTQAMPGDYGVNPLGTLGEFYLNFGVSGAILGGAMCAVLLLLAHHHFNLTTSGTAAWILCYPLLARWFLGVNYNFSQNVSEILRGLILAFLVALVIRVAYSPTSQIGLSPKDRLSWPRGGLA